MLLPEILVEKGYVPRIPQVRRSLEELVDESVHFGHHVVADVFAANLRGMDMFNKLRRAIHNEQDQQRGMRRSAQEPECLKYCLSDKTRMCINRTVLCVQYEMGSS